jgi:hypothetical protein
MFKQLKMKIAARRVTRTKKKTPGSKKTGFWATVWNIVSWPFRALAQLFKCIWSWIRSIDLIGLVNLTLLSSIVALFSMLILDITKCSKKTVVLVATEAVPVSVAIANTETIDEQKNFEKTVQKAERPAQKITLPLKKQAQPCCNAEIAKTAQIEKKTFVANGNLIIDGEFPGEARLSCDTQINGNVYLQNMRRYTLPCGTQIRGDLFLRNIGMLRFCGPFTVTGNIYVSRSSSFGPIPSNARVGGQVIL